MSIADFQLPIANWCGTCVVAAMGCGTGPATAHFAVTSVSPVFGIAVPPVPSPADLCATAMPLLLGNHGGPALQEVVWRLGWTLVHFLWQGLAIALLAGAILWLLRKRSASARYTVGCAAILLCVSAVVTTFALMPAPRRVPAVVRSIASVPLSVVRQQMAPPESPVFLGPMTSDAQTLHRKQPTASFTPVRSIETRPADKLRALARRLEPGLPWIVAGWLLGILLLSLRLLHGWINAQKIRRRFVEPATQVALDTLAGLRQRLRVSRPVCLLTSALVQVPVTIGWLKPVILLPISAITGLTQDQLTAILAHELAHIRRYDYLVNLLQSAVETLLFYHPAVWWLSRRIRIEREHCCDDLAVACCGDTLLYARTLVTLEELRGQRGAPPLVAAATGGSLLDRIRRLTVHSHPSQRGPVGWLMIGMLLALVSAIGLRTLSVRAGQPGRAASAKNETPEPSLRATFPNGVGVELVGVREEFPTTSDWWRPDGGKLEAPLPFTQKGDVAGNAGAAYHFAVHITGHESPSCRVRLSDTRAAASTRRPMSPKIGDQPGEILPDWYSITYSFPADHADRVDLSVGVDVGEPVLVASDSGKTGTSLPMQKGDTTVAFHAAELTADGGFAVVCAFTDHQPYREPFLLAWDDEGKSHRADSTSYTNVGDVVTHRAVFKKPAREHLKRIDLMAQRFDWVAFKNVSLSAGRLTAARAVVDVERSPQSQPASAIASAQTSIAISQLTQADVRRYLTDQMALVKDEKVLNQVLADPVVVATRWYQSQPDVNRALENLRNGLIVTANKNSDYVSVTFPPAPPQDAATIVNAVLGSYLKHVHKLSQSQFASELQNYKAQEKVLSDQLDRLLKEKHEFMVKEIDAAGIDQGVSIVGESLRAYEAQVAQLEQEKLQAKAMYDNLQTVDPSQIVIIPEMQMMIQQDARVSTLQQSKAQLEQAKALSLRQFGANHHQVQALQDQIDQTDKQLNEATSKKEKEARDYLIDSTGTRYLNAMQAELQLRERLEKETAKQHDLDQASQRYREFEDQQKRLTQELSQLRQYMTTLQVMIVQRGMGSASRPAADRSGEGTLTTQPATGPTRSGVRLSPVAEPAAETNPADLRERLEQAELLWDLQSRSGDLDSPKRGKLLAEISQLREQIRQADNASGLSIFSLGMTEPLPGSTSPSDAIRSDASPQNIRAKRLSVDGNGIASLELRFPDHGVLDRLLDGRKSLPDVFEERPPGSGRYEPRGGIIQAHVQVADGQPGVDAPPRESRYQHLHGELFYVPNRDQFYMELYRSLEALLSGELLLYGPFPADMLRGVLSGVSFAASQPAAAAGTAEDEGIAVGDQLSIRMLDFLYRDVETEIRPTVDELGYITIPQLGWVPVEGLSLSDLHDDLIRRAKAANIYAQDSQPTVLVSFLLHQPARKSQPSTKPAGGTPAPTSQSAVSTDQDLAVAIEARFVELPVADGQKLWAQLRNRADVTTLAEDAVLIRDRDAQWVLDQAKSGAKRSDAVAPRLLTRDKQQATFHMGGEEPVFLSSVENPKSAPFIFYFFSGRSLSCTPIISPDHHHMILEMSASINSIQRRGKPVETIEESAFRAKRIEHIPDGFTLMARCSFSRDRIVGVQSRRTAVNATEAGLEFVRKRVSGPAAEEEMFVLVKPTITVPDPDMKKLSGFPKESSSNASISLKPAAETSSVEGPQPTGSESHASTAPAEANGLASEIRDDRAAGSRHRDDRKPTPISVAEEAGGTGVYYITGKVQRPGVYAKTGLMLTLRQAVAAAGGVPPSLLPRRLSCEISRHVAPRTTTTTFVNLDDVSTGIRPDPAIQPGDLIHIRPESRPLFTFPSISSSGAWWNAFLDPSQVGNFSGPDTGETVRYPSDVPEEQSSTQPALPFLKKLDRPENKVVGVFYVTGHVVRPGVYALTGQYITLRRAIAAAGGIDATAKKPACQIVRRKGDSGEQTIAIDDLDVLISGRRPDMDIQPDDVINVASLHDVRHEQPPEELEAKRSEAQSQSRTPTSETPATRKILRGVVLQPDGKPAAGAEVSIAGEDSSLMLRRGGYGIRRVGHSGKYVDAATSSAAGEFSVDKVKGRFLLVVTHETGYSELTDTEFKSSRITLKAWGRVEGVALAGAETARNEKIMLSHHWWMIDDSLRMGFTGMPHTPRVELLMDSATDDQGHFVFDRTPPIVVQLARQRKLADGGFTPSVGVGVEVKPGDTTRVTIGGPGRLVVGRLLAPKGLHNPIDWAGAALGSVRGRPGPLALFPTVAQRQRWDEECAKLPNFSVLVDAEGRFEVENIPAGNYDLSMSVMSRPPGGNGPPSKLAGENEVEPGVPMFSKIPVLKRAFTNRSKVKDEQQIATITHPFSIPEITAGESLEPLDLGDLQTKAR